MLGFSDELCKSLKLNLKEIYSEYKVLNIGGKACYVQNYVKIITYSKEKVILKVKNNELVIEGYNMQIEELEQKNILLVGKINKIYLTYEFKGVAKNEE